MNMKKIYLGTLAMVLVLIISLNAQAKDKDKSFLLSSKTRAMGMGGAYVGVTHKWDTMLWNPAGLEISGLDNESFSSNTSLYLNNAAAPLALSGIIKADLEEARVTNEEDESAPAWQLLFTIPPILGRGGMYAMNDEFAIAWNFSEDILPHETFEYSAGNSGHENFWDNRSYSISAKNQFTPQLMGGVNLSYYRMYQNMDRKAGSSAKAGLMYYPSPDLTVGLMYFQASNPAKDIELPMERFANKSTNLGFSYRPADGTEIALDVRNLLDKTEPARGEMHLGFEQGINKWMTVRAGYYKDKDSKDDNVSVGFALKWFGYSLVNNLDEHIRSHFFTATSTVNF